MISGQPASDVKGGDETAFFACADDYCAVVGGPDAVGEDLVALALDGCAVNGAGVRMGEVE